jgi:hypothetical protein
VAARPHEVGGRVAASMTVMAHRRTQRLGLWCVRSGHGEDVSELLVRAEAVQGREQQLCSPAMAVADHGERLLEL